MVSVAAAVAIVLAVVVALQPDVVPAAAALTVGYVVGRRTE